MFQPVDTSWSEGNVKEEIYGEVRTHATLLLDTIFQNMIFSIFYILINELCHLYLYEYFMHQNNLYPKIS